MIKGLRIQEVIKIGFFLLNLAFGALLRTALYSIGILKTSDKKVNYTQKNNVFY